MSDMPDVVWVENRMSTKMDGFEVLHCRKTRLDNGTQYVRADLIGLKCFYDYKGDLPDKFIAIFGDGSGCEIYYYSHDDQYAEKMYTSTSDRDDIIGVDKDWFIDAGYLWFIDLPDDFHVWGESDE